MMPPKSRLVSRSALLFIPIALAGCQKTQPPAANNPTAIAPRVEVTHGLGPLAGFDPCGERIEDLCAPLLLYYRDNKHGPSQVAELQQYANALPGIALRFSCPVSGKEYLCAPQGLQAPGEDILIYIYDAEPVHAGERWCAVSKTGAIAGADGGFFSEHIPEARFKHFIDPSATPAAPQPPAP